jgi:hypothetical protein
MNMSLISLQCLAKTKALFACLKVHHILLNKRAKLSIP